MPAEPNPWPGPAEGLSAVLVACLEARDVGRPLDREALLARYPHFAAELSKFLDDQEGLECQVAPLRALAQTPAPALQPPAVAPTELGDFRLGRELGRGGMGVVYEAEQVSLRRKVALKVLPLAATLDPRRLQRFQNEARAAASLHHTNIVPVFAVGEQQGVHYYAMQLIAGQTLAAVLQELRGQAQQQGTSQAAPDSPAGPETTAHSPSPGAAACDSTGPQAALSTLGGVARREYLGGVARLGAQAAEALDYAHQLGVVHRDIKPGNLMVDARGQVWVTDFGLALFQQGEPGLTLTGDLVGTLRYMSPEQALAKRVVIDHRTDVYSLGATLYELLTLHPVFPGTDRQELLRQIAFEEPAPLRKLNKAVPTELDTIVLKALEKNPAERYATAQELADDLHRFLQDRPIQARRPSWARVAAKWTRRHKTLIGAVSVVLVVTAVLGAGSWLWWAQKRVAAEGEAREALREAAGLLQEERWPEALSAARRAEGVLAGLGADPGLCQDARTLIEDLEMAHRLQEASLQATVIKDQQRDWGATDSAYAEAFGEYRLDVDRLDADSAAERIRARPIRRQLVAALDDWAYTRKRLQAKGWSKRLAAARAADMDAWRNRLRDALEGSDSTALAKAAATDRADDWPTQTLVLLGRLARRTTSAERVAALLGRAQQRHPGDFWLNEELAMLFVESHRPQPEKALRFFATAVALRPQSSASHYNLGGCLMYNGQLDQAIAEFREVLRLSKKDLPQAHNSLGVALNQTGQLDEAITELREAVRIEPKAEYHNNLGNALRNKGNLDEAIAELRAAIRNKPGWADAHSNLGCALHDNAQLDQAIAEYREAIRLKKDYPEAHNNLGGALYDKRRLDEAIAEYREALRLKKDYPFAHNGLGAALMAKGQPDQAIAEFREALRLNKDYPEAHRGLGSALRDKGQLDDAIAEYHEAIRLKNDFPEAHNSLGVALFDKGRLDEAVAEYHEAIRLKKNDPIPHNNLGNVLRAKGLLTEAIAEHREALRLNTNYPEAHNNLGTVLKDLGRLDEAIAEYREAIRFKKDYAHAHYNLANALKENGRLDEAIAEYREAICLKKEFPESHYNLADALKKKGRLDEAIAEYREAIRLKKDYRDAHGNLGVALKEKGLLEEAIAEFQEVLRLKKDDPLAHYCLGNTLRDKGRPEDAIAEYHEAIRLKKDYAEAHCNLGHVLVRQGQFHEAVKELRLGHELGSRNARWPYPSAQWLRNAERLADLDARLPALLDGREEPKDAGERLALAELCQQHKKLYAAAVRWYGEAFAAQPPLADDRPSDHRYNAACAAALAGCGKGKDATELSAPERDRLRKQACDWLKADLQSWARLLDEQPEKAGLAVTQKMAHWLKDSDFADMRGLALDKLPAAERAHWQKLWQDVEALRQRATRQRG
jgi:tetratricopeptide (TPR) repeat protein